MRLTPDQLKMKALLAIEEAGEQICQARPAGTLQLRFALAFLYAIGNGERWLFDQFWRAANGENGRIGIAFQDNIARRQTVTASLNGIWRSVGIERNGDLYFEARRLTRDAVPRNPAAGRHAEYDTSARPAPAAPRTPHDPDQPIDLRKRRRRR